MSIILTNADKNKSDECLELDKREALFNAGESGPINHIQVSTERIVQLSGILLDIDPSLYHDSLLLPVIPTDPHEFYAAVVQKWLVRHSVLDRAEVRISGRGLHVIIWFSQPVVFESTGERDRWDGIIKVIQAVLPTDPEAPAITAVTRPLGSVNSKTGRKVEQLKAGEGVAAKEVEELYAEICKAPFRVILRILAGTDQLSPCPFCNREESTLSALDRIGRCYAHCGKIKLEQLYDLIFAARSHVGKEVA